MTHCFRRALGFLPVGLLSFACWAAQGPEPLNMGFYLPGIRDANLADVKVSLQLWAEEVGKPYKLQAKALTYDDMPTLYRDVVQHRVSIVIAPGMELAETFSPDELVEGFAGRRHGTDEGMALIVPRNSPVHKFADLRGKRLLRLANDRLAETFLEVQCRHQLALACRELFSMSEEKRDIQPIHKVFFGQADAALVSLSALYAASELNPQVAERLRIVLDWKTRALSFGMMTVYSTPDFRDLVLRAAMQASKTVRGKQILELFKTDYMDRVNKSDLEPYWHLRREHQELVNTKAARKK
ncbi:MAG: hypothetical protein IPG66_14675 [Hydrogenophilales bacterium]|nr:hypothetical protein [Hydrogenophilales bacterium]